MTIDPPTHPTAPDLPKGGARFYVPALDGARSLAFLLVFWLHMSIAAFHSSAWGWPSWGRIISEAISDIGEMGVPLFFVMSAFLVTKLLLIERERTGRIDVKAFLIRRTLRIWPLYYAFLLVSGVAMMFLPLPDLTQNRTDAKIAYLFFMGDVYNALNGSYDLGIVWSLGVEEKFYILWPFALAGLGALAATRSIVRAGWVLIIGGIISTLASAKLGGIWAVLWWPSNHAMAFGAGILLSVDGFPEVRIGRRALIPAFLAALFGTYLIISFAVKLLPGPVSSAWPAAAKLIVGTAICALFLGAARRVEGGVLTSRPAVELGRRSFGAYLFHILPVSVAIELFPTFGRKYLLAILGAFGFTLALAWLSYKYFETPFLKLKARFERVASRAI